MQIELCQIVLPQDIYIWYYISFSQILPGLFIGNFKGKISFIIISKIT